MYILGGTSAGRVAANLAAELHQPLLQTTFKRFPDDEFYVRLLDSVAGDEVLIVQTAYPDEKIVELFLMQDAVYDAGAKKITVVLPYFGTAGKTKNSRKARRSAHARLQSTSACMQTRSSP